MKVKRKGFGFLLIPMVLLASISNTFAKSRSSYKSRSSPSSSSSSGSYSRSAPSYPSYSHSYTYSRPSYSYSRPSPSYSNSRPSPSYPSNSVKAQSYSKASASNSRKAPSPTSVPWFGWNVQASQNSGGSKSEVAKPPASNIGWNVGNGNTNTASKPASTNIGWNIGNANTNTAHKASSTNIGWNVTPKPSAPIEPPPPYPGLQNKPVPSNNAPPDYYPSHNNPPAYSQNHPSQPNYKPGHHSQSSYSPSHHSSPSYKSSHRTSGSNYFLPIPEHHKFNGTNNYNANAFGRQGLPRNSYISNNYYGEHKKSGKSNFLTNALFLGGGLAGGYALGQHASRNGEKDRKWNEVDDKRWRATTRAPYFENKIPGEEKILPASAVNGAAIAFGLVSLLPLNVPKGMPLMYCNDTYLMQSHIQINDGNIYQCVNNTIQIWCPQKYGKELKATEQPIVTTEDPYMTTATEVTDYTESLTEATEIPKREAEQTEQQMCINKTMECDVVDDKKSGIVYCSNGNLFSKIDIFCNDTTIENDTSILNCYEGHLPERKAAYIPTTIKPTVTTKKPLTFDKKVSKFFLQLFDMDELGEDDPDYTEFHEISPESWYPEALTIPTTEPPFEWMKPVQVRLENGTIGTKLVPIPSDVVEYLEQMSQSGNKIDGHFAWVKVYKTNPIDPVDSEKSAITD